MSNQNILCCNPLHFTSQIWEESSSFFSLILLCIIEGKKKIPSHPPLSLFFSKVNKSSSQSPSHTSCAPWTHCSMPTSFLHVKPRTGHDTAGAASQELGRREKLLLLDHWQHLLIQPWMCLAFIIRRTHCWLRFNLLTTRTSQTFSAEQFSSQWVPACTDGVILSHVQVSAFAFVGLHRVSVCHFVQPVDMVLGGSPPLQHVTLSSTVVPSMDFLWAHSILSAWLLMKMWNNISPSYQPPADLQTSHHCPSSITVQADFHPPCSLCIQSLLLQFTNKPAMGGCMESLAEFEVSPFVLSSQCFRVPCVTSATAIPPQIWYGGGREWLDT